MTKPKTPEAVERHGPSSLSGKVPDPRVPFNTTADIHALSTYKRVEVSNETLTPLDGDKIPPMHSGLEKTQTE